jgi:hypothetical protein
MTFTFAVPFSITTGVIAAPVTSFQPVEPSALSWTFPATLIVLGVPVAAPVAAPEKALTSDFI